MSKDEWVTKFVSEYVTQGNANPDAAARRWVAKAK